MKKKEKRKIIIMGISLVILLIMGVIYSIIFNDGRWVKEMYLPNYTFSVKDIPMFIIGALIVVYVIYVLFVYLKNRKNK